MDIEYIKHTEGDDLKGNTTIYVAFHDVNMLTVKHTEYLTSEAHSVEETEGYKGGYEPFIAGNTVPIGEEEFWQAFNKATNAISDKAKALMY